METYIEFISIVITVFIVAIMFRLGLIFLISQATYDFYFKEDRLIKIILLIIGVLLLVASIILFFLGYHFYDFIYRKVFKIYRWVGLL